MTTTLPAFTGTNREHYIPNLDLTLVDPSKTNPRTHFDPLYITELSGTIREKGVMQPIIVRPAADGRAEIVAGECRFRASKAAGKTTIPAILRDYDDEQVLELQLIENIHRKDLTPLEQAVGYRKLIDTNPTKHSAESIAQRIGMSVAWVWDRLKLNDLIPEAQEILDLELMTVGHAILIARLKPEDQERVIRLDHGRNDSGAQRAGLWQSQGGDLLEDDDDADAKAPRSEYDGVKAVSIRELDSWIRDHVRFDVEHMAKAVPFQFEATAERVKEAAAQPGRGKKLISITHEYRVAEDARDEKDRTYGSQSWERADGQFKSKTCEHSVLGVVVAGEGYGDTFQVCVARDKCRVHFGDVIKAKEKAQKQRESGDGKKAAKTEEAEARRRQREEEAAAAKRARFAAFKASLSKAADAAIKNLPATLPRPVFAALLKSLGLPKDTKPAQLAKALLVNETVHAFRQAYGYYDEARLVTWVKALGVDVKACEPKSDEKPKKAAKK